MFADDHLPPCMTCYITAKFASLLAHSPSAFRANNTLDGLCSLASRQRAWLLSQAVSCAKREACQASRPALAGSASAARHIGGLCAGCLATAQRMPGQCGLHWPAPALPAARGSDIAAIASAEWLAEVSVFAGGSQNKHRGGERKKRREAESLSGKRYTERALPSEFSCSCDVAQLAGHSVC